MRTTSAEHISLLQRNPKNIRNICILAHVDHGKTTLADALVASNGIISSRLAGKLRYMDSREDEQIRGITMKSSAISLHYAEENEEFLINFIDSPGHVDFSSEVSTAVRLCDGALVVVDVVEGVSPQTQVVLRQAWLENIHPCLVLNKIDRLITELKYSTLEAYFHIQRILEQVNAITGKLFSSRVMEKSSTKVENTKKTNHCTMDDDTTVSIEQWSSGLEEEDDSSLYFSPDQGNVVFASAIDGWGFSINDFVAIYSKKLGLNAEILRKTLWGDFYLDPKSKRIFKKAQSKGKKPLFVQFVLQNIWAIYEAVMRRDNIKTEQIVKSLNIKLSARDSRSTDPRVCLRAILGQWLPLSSTVLSMVVNKLPSPLQMAEERVETLMCSGLRTFDSLPEKAKSLKRAFMACSSDENAPVIVFVSKMFPVDDRSLPKHKKRPLTQEEIALRRERARQKHAEMLSKQVNNTTASDPPTTHTISLDVMHKTPKDNEEPSLPKTHFMAFARVYSGTIRKEKALYVLGPKHDPGSLEEEEEEEDIQPLNSDSQDSLLTNDSDHKDEGLFTVKSVDRGTNRHIAVFKVDDLYLLMGRELEALDSVPAGNVLGIGGLQNHVLKSATIASTTFCPAFTALHMEARPIVRVAVEPEHYADIPALARGMRLLNQADPCVETLVQNTGEHVIIAAGEVHLERCIADLKERFACVPFNVSAPIIPFRETVVLPPKVDMVKEAITGDQPLQPTKQFSSETSPETSKNVSNKDKGLVEITTANKQCTIHIRAVPLPENVASFLDTKTETIKVLTSDSGSTNLEQRKNTSQMSNKSKEEIQEFYDKLKELFNEAGDEWKDAIDNIWAFGPRRTGPNILLNRIPDYERPSVWEEGMFYPQCTAMPTGPSPFMTPELTNSQLLFVSSANEVNDGRYKNYDNSILSGFQLATLAGPLCEEPLMGVCFVIEKILIDQPSETGKAGYENTCTAGQTGLDLEDARCFYKENTILESGSSKQKDTGLPSVNVEGNEGELLLSFSEKETLTEDAKEKSSTSPNEGEQSNEKSDEETANKGEKLDSDNFENVDSKELSKTEEHREKTTTSFPSQGSNFDRFGPLSGQIMSAVKEGCRRAFQLQPMRLMAAMYTCHIQATAEVLGRMYAVIGKREGRVLSEEMMEGSDVFDVEAVLPVAESFGFAEEIRKRTSGLANPQLVFSHWEVVDIDPYWVPTTEEEYMHFGAKADSENQARKYMNSVRRRKGLYVEEKTVEHAEKQRTLKK